MTPNIVDVKAQDNYEILLSFENGEIKVFDMKPYIDKGFFKQLQDKTYLTFAPKSKHFLSNIL